MLTSKHQSSQGLGKVSIVLPTYNGARRLRESIDSCLNQTYRNIELVIVDDGSADKTASIVASYSDDRISYIRHEANRGLPQALNTGFAQTTGEYLTWTSDDNLYAPDAIETMVEFLCAHPNVDFVYSGYYLINDDNQMIGEIEAEPVEALMWHNCVGACFLYRRHVYEVTGDFDPAFLWTEDYQYWLRVSRAFVMKRLERKQTLYYYRVHGEALSDKPVVRLERARRANRARWRVFGEEAKTDRRLRSDLYMSTANHFLRSGDIKAARHSALLAVLSHPYRPWKARSILFRSLLGNRMAFMIEEPRDALTRLWCKCMRYLGLKRSESGS